MKLVMLTPEGKTHLPGREVIFMGGKVATAACNKNKRFNPGGHPVYVESDAPTCDKCSHKMLKKIHAMWDAA